MLRSTPLVSALLSSLHGAEPGTVAGWGNNSAGQLYFVPGLTNITSVSAGEEHVAALREDRSVVVWGYMGFDAPTGLTNVQAVAAGTHHTVALRRNGTVVEWNPWNPSRRPPAGLDRVAGVAAGGDVSVAVRSNGTVVAWGDNGSGQTNVPAGLAGVKAVAAGALHVLALRTNGTVVAWGDNTLGQTGVPSGLSNVTLIAAAGHSSLAATADGTVWSWGAIGGVPPNDWTELLGLAAGFYHALVLKSDRTVRGWGFDGYGQLTLPPDLTNVLSLSAGFHTTLAVVRGPVLRAHPQSLELLAGTNATFTAEAEARTPFQYQWWHDGQPIPQATNHTLNVAQIGPADAGNYSVVASNAGGTMTSASATLTVRPLLILVHPQSGDTYTGADVRFSVGVQSLAPVSYQWLFNRVYPIPGATNESLLLTNAAYSDQGVYSVVVSNQYGTGRSFAATLRVAPTWTVDDASVVKVTGATNVLTFHLRLLEPRPEALTLNYSSQQDSAIAGVDFTPPSGSVTFPPFVTERLLQVAVLGNTNREPRRFFLTIYSLRTDPYDGFLRRVATAWILVEDYVPTVSVSPSSLPEGDLSHAALLDAILSGPAVRPVSVSFGTSDGSARAGRDYLSAGGRLMFPPISLTQTLSVTILGNVVRQPNRDFSIALTQAVDARVAEPPSRQMILDDDALVLPAGFKAELAATNLSFPSAMELSPDGRLFVCDQDGSVRVVKHGVVLAEPFLEVDTDSFDWAEAGLLGIAFDPEFPVRSFVYVYYTALGPFLHNRVSRFTVAGDVTVPGSEQVLLELDRLANAFAHNGGGIHFGPDGKLYIGVGENFFGPNAQSLTNLLGKILRINPDGSIPGDNPFFNSAQGVNRAIWAYGLRNPFSFAFQPGTGRLLINDVGDATWEEIEAGRAGANYGWPAAEGPSSNQAYAAPLFAYGHTPAGVAGCAIVGAAFYNPSHSQFPAEYLGNYFFADYCGGWIRRLKTDDQPAEFVTGAAHPVDLRVGLDGALYCLVQTYRFTGLVYRISYDDRGRIDWVRRLADDRTQVHVSGVLSRPQVLEASGDLARWRALGTNSTGALEFDFYDSAVSGGEARFYRLAE
jgi:glucose/arabinose dehydrogenase